MKVLLIQVPKAAQDYNLVHDLRNAAEDIYRKFMADEVVQIPDMDSAVTELHVLVSASRHWGDVTSFTKKVLKRYGLLELAKISQMSATEYSEKQVATAKR